VPGLAAGLQDAGWAYDRVIIDRDRLAIARVALPLPQQCEYLRRSADHCFDRGDIDGAERLIRESLAIAPNAEDHNALLRYLLASPAATDEQFFVESRRWAALYAGEERLQSAVYGNDRGAERALRVGYMCDFVHTPLAQHTLVPLFQAHDRRNVQVCYYNHGPDSATARAVSDTYHDVRGLTDDQLFARIQDDRVDLLVDLNGRLRVENRYGVLCRKPAPIQVNWYNLLASTGLRAFDFIVSDQVSLPLDKQRICTEEIIHVDCQVAGSWRLPETPPVAPQPALSKGTFVFASFGAAFKNNQGVLDLWCRLMHETSGTILYLKNSTFYTPAYKHAVRDYFVARGVAPERLRLEHRSDFHEMRALYADVDLCLDTFPYGNGSTTINALWQGVPTISLALDEWRARTAASIMTNAGLAEFVTRTPDEYVERARYYAAHPRRLAEIRATIRQTLVNSGYYNIEIFARDLERGYRRMWHRWLERTAAI
jgi:protein O-GlcNAc transferase